MALTARLYRAPVAHHRSALPRSNAHRIRDARQQPYSGWRARAQPRLLRCAAIHITTRTRVCCKTSACAAFLRRGFWFLQHRRVLRCLNAARHIAHAAHSARTPARARCALIACRAARFALYAHAACAQLRMVYAALCVCSLTLRAHDQARGGENDFLMAASCVASRVNARVACRQRRRLNNLFPVYSAGEALTAAYSGGMPILCL